MTWFSMAQIACDAVAKVARPLLNCANVRGATANLKLTFHPDHSVGGNHVGARDFGRRHPRQSIHHDIFALCDHSVAKAHVASAGSLLAYLKSVCVAIRHEQAVAFPIGGDENVVLVSNDNSGKLGIQTHFRLTLHQMPLAKVLEPAFRTFDAD